MNRRSFVELLATARASASLSSVTPAATLGKAEPILVEAGQTRHAGGQTLEVPDEFQCKLRTSDLDGRLSLVLGNHSPFTGSPLHLHRDVDEWFFVLKGDFIVEVNGKVYRLKEAASLLAPQKIPHRYLNGPTPGSLLMTFSPGGRMEEFSERNAQRRRDHQQLDHEEMVAYWASYKLDLLGGHLTEEDFRKAGV